MLSVLTICSQCVHWVYGSLSPVITPTSYGGLGVPDGCGGGIGIGASEEADDSPTSRAPSSISEGAEVVGLDSVTGNQEDAQTVSSRPPTR